MDWKDMVSEEDAARACQRLLSACGVGWRLRPRPSPKAGTREVLAVGEISKDPGTAEMSKTSFGDRSECELWLAARGLELGDKIDDAYGGVFSSWAVREVRT